MYELPDFSSAVTNYSDSSIQFLGHCKPFGGEFFFFFLLYAQNRKTDRRGTFITGRLLLLTCSGETLTGSQIFIDTRHLYQRSSTEKKKES